MSAKTLLRPIQHHSSHRRLLEREPRLLPPARVDAIVVPAARHTDAASWIAVICGTPTPATTRVVQMAPGPTPTLTTSAPASIS